MKNSLNDCIPVTKSFLPPIEDYTSQVSRAFDNNWLTNRGELVLELESKLKKYLNVDNILITNNGTVPIQIAIKLFGKNKEIITTPFSYIATSSSILWEGCKPVFADIDLEHLTIDESKIEALITENTTCILATHVFGNPCNVDAINKIAKKYNLKVIYDAAHCFGVEFQDQSIFNYGDISTCSFHATKLFHTAEGGAIFCNDKNLVKEVYYSHNFGHDGPLKFHGLGINAKISEIQAAMGLSVLPYMEDIIQSRKKSVEYYLSELDQKNIQFLKIRKGTKWNYSYFPILLKSENILLKVQSILNDNNIIPRRYFYPSLNTIEYIKGNKCSVSEDVSSRVLCLPLYHGMTDDELSKVINLINSTLK